MSRRDKYHDIAKAALLKDGWRITADPYILVVGQRNLYIDLAAQRGPIALEKEGRKILVEVKSFVGLNEMHDLYEAIGQYIFYREHLAQQEAEPPLYLAVPRLAYEGVWTEPAGRIMIEAQSLKLVVFDIEQEVIIRWIN
jgi:hypothetical protein